MDEGVVYNKHVAMNARRIFRLPSDYDALQLKERYKRLLRTHHPDKGGDQDSFLYITRCYKYLYRELERRSEKNFQELRADARAQGGELPSPAAPKGLLEADTDRFAEKFNAFYDKHGVPDASVSKGYDQFMARSQVEADDQSNFKVERYRPPSPQHLCGKMRFMELGADQETFDFSGKNDVKNGLHFTDYRRAHTTSRLVDESLLHQRESFDTLEDIKSRRAKADFKMNQEEERRYTREHRRQSREELERQARVKRRDQSMFKHFDSVSRMQIA